MFLIIDGCLEGVNDYGKIEKFINFLVDYVKDKLFILSIIENFIKV